MISTNLARWHFDTNSWVGEQGQMPLTASTNLQSVADWSTNAVRINSTNSASLKYRDYEANGNANINLRNGSVSFWFSPDWSSATTNSGVGLRKTRG